MGGNVSFSRFKEETSDTANSLSAFHARLIRRSGTKVIVDVDGFPVDGVEAVRSKLNKMRESRYDRDNDTYYLSRYTESYGIYFEQDGRVKVSLRKTFSGDLPTTDGIYDEINSLVDFEEVPRLQFTFESRFTDLPKAMGSEGVKDELEDDFSLEEIAWSKYILKSEKGHTYGLVDVYCRVSELPDGLEIQYVGKFDSDVLDDVFSDARKIFNHLDVEEARS